MSITTLSPQPERDIILNVIVAMSRSHKLITLASNTTHKIV